MNRILCVCLMLAVGSVLFAVPAASEAVRADTTRADFGVCYATLGNGDPDAGALITINLATGAGTVVGPTGITGEFSDLGVPALAIKYTGEIYAMDIGTSSNLYRINADAGTATLIGPTGLSSPPAIGFDGNDLLHAIDSNGDLYTIDHLTGTATFVAATGKFIKGMAFDPVTAILWGCDASSNVYTINEKTGATTLVGNSGLNPSPDLCFTTTNDLVASSGGGLGNNNLISIDKSTGAGTVIGPVGFRSVSGLAMRHDRLSPVMLQAFNSRWIEDRVEIAWRLFDATGTLSFDITRTSGNTGDRETIRDARVVRRGDNYVFEDHSTEPGNTYSYRITIHEDGESITTFETSITTPSGRFALEQNHPNPFNPSTSISFSIDRDVHIVLAVYDVSGRRVATLVDRPMHAGRNTERWDGRDSTGNPVATGVYFFRLTAGSKTLIRKAVLTK